ncbi:hypothetical protein [Chryseobacterium oranimense]|uniref:hypothetical protein n=1 Tax=Chryseobacterium oranimense TaxID=421058 RepID=UPI0031DC9018
MKKNKNAEKKLNRIVQLLSSHLGIIVFISIQARIFQKENGFIYAAEGGKLSSSKLPDQQKEKIHQTVYTHGGKGKIAKKQFAAFNSLLTFLSKSNISACPVASNYKKYSLLLQNNFFYPGYLYTRTQILNIVRLQIQVFRKIQFCTRPPPVTDLF